MIHMRKQLGRRPEVTLRALDACAQALRAQGASQVHWDYAPGVNMMLSLKSCSWESGLTYSDKIESLQKKRSCEMGRRLVCVVGN